MKRPNNDHIIVGLAPVGVSGTEHVVLEVAKNLALARGIEAHLTSADDRRADLLVIDADSAEGHKRLADPTEKRPRLVFAQQANANDPFWLEKPIRVQTLMDALHELCLAHQRSGAPQIQPAPAGAIHKAPVTTPTEEKTSQAAPLNFYRVLLRARRERRTLLISGLDNIPDVLIHGPKEIVVTNGTPDVIRKLAGMSLDNHEVSEPDTNRLAPIEELAGTFPLELVLWTAALHAGDEVIAGGYTLDTPIQMKAWPNFTRFEVTPQHIMLCSLMVRRPLSINTLARQTGIPVRDIIHFHNAALAIDYLILEPQQQAARPASQQNAAQTSRKGLFAKLAKHLSFLQTAVS